MKIEPLNRQAWRAVPVAALLLAAAGGAHAGYDFTPFLDSSAGAGVGNQDDEVIPTFGEFNHIDGPHAGIITSQGSALRPDVGSGNASSYAGYGVLGVSASTSVRIAPQSTTAPSSSSGFAGAGVEFADSLLIDAPGRTGQTGTMKVPWILSGTWGGGLTGPLPRSLEQASSTWEVGISTGSYYNDYFHTFSQVIASGEFYADKEFNETSSISSHRMAPDDVRFVVDSQYDTAVVPTLWSELSFIFGIPLTLGANLSISTQAYASNEGIDLDDPGYLQLRSADAYGDFGHTLRWGGVQQVSDANGNAVTGWTISAESGTDYAVANTTAVPEPATWLSMLAGLLAIALRSAPRGFHRRCSLRRRGANA